MPLPALRTPCVTRRVIRDDVTTRGALLLRRALIMRCAVSRVRARQRAAAAFAAADAATLLISFRFR